jgi:hypothetical protein
MPKPKKRTQEEFEQSRKQDAHALAQLIYDIYQEKKAKERQDAQN